MSDFDKAVAFVLDSECVFQKGHHGNFDFVMSENVKGDRGGLTKFGIDHRSHPDVDIENLTLEQAKEIYRTEYWLKGLCDKMPWPVSFAHFDACVNTGIGQAAKFLQRAIGADADGAIGPKTLKALVLACGTRGPVAIAEEIVSSRETFYKKLAADNKEDEKFLDGWLNRVSNLQTKLQNIC